MNIYHITYSPTAKIVHLHFWGCNLSCRACLLRKEIYDCHLDDTRDGIFNKETETNETPQRFLGLTEVMEILGRLEIRSVIFMGGEAAIDPSLPQLAEALHKQFKSYNILLTNGLQLTNLGHIDEVVFSIKAITDSLHSDYTGKSNKDALKNFVSLNQSGVRLRTESIFIPEYIDLSETERIAKFIGDINKTIPYRIDAFIPVGDNPWRRPTPEEMTEAVTVARKHLLNVSHLTGNEDLKFEVLRVF